MLEDAVTSMKAGQMEVAEERWSPQITIGMPVLIPEDYVADVWMRLGLYRRREEGPGAKVRPDMKVVFFDSPKPEQRLKGTTFILRTLVAIASKKKAA